MGLPLPLHISIHIFFALLAGFIVWRIWKKPVAAFSAALISGVAVDYDHFIDYFLAFGGSFNLHYFIKGYEFLKTDKLYILLHGWEYAAILLLIALILKDKSAKSVFLALFLGLFFHLASDVFLDKVPAKSYSIICRVRNNFDLEKLSYPEKWEKHLRYKKIYNIDQ